MRYIPNVLSIQSHVVYGHVGNDAAVFALQRLGIEVWPLMTVQFSNHPGHGNFTGQVLPADHIADVVKGLAALGAMAQCDAVLTGYLGDRDLGVTALDAVKRVKAENPEAIYVCDPVMGDSTDGLFVRDDIPAFFKSEALPAADIVTPNLFELELLSGRRIATMEDAVALGRQLITLGPRLVLVTGLIHGNTRPGTVEVLCVTRTRAWRVVTPFLDLDPMPNGAGDTLSALFLGCLLRAGGLEDAAAKALEAAVAAIFAVIEKTAEIGGRELALVAAGDSLVAPARRFPAESLD